ncbi:MAG TPA: MarR family transcriptional regulator [Streptosporangiaceae bacterium]|nr:MarR family transcriptional regulator [Streptosporangiaceae bacterium]
MLSNSEQPSGETHGAGLILALQRTTHATLRLLAVRLAEENLSPSEINALANLADGRVRSVGELAAAAGVRPTTLTSLLDRLAKRGYLTRELDPADRRSFQLHLTPAGAPAAASALAAMTEIEREAASSLTEADLAGFTNVLRALQEVSR